MDLLEKQFYNLFWKNQFCQNLFLVPKSELLQNEVELIVSKELAYPPRIVLSNFDSSVDEENETDILRIESQFIEIKHKLQNAAKKYLNEELVKNYFTRRFGNIIHLIKTDYNSYPKKLEYFKYLIDSIKGNENLAKLFNKYQIKTTNNSLDLSETLSYYLEQIKIDYKKFLTNENLVEMIFAIDFVSEYYNQKIADNLFIATKYYTNIFTSKDGFENRIALFDRLFELGILIGKEYKSYFECVNCGLDTFRGTFKTNLKPSKLNLVCPNCGETTRYMVPYKIHDSIYKHILHPDGILFFAIQYLLIKEKISFEVDKKYLSDIQFDIEIFESQELLNILEVKMFKTNLTEETLKTKLLETVKQVKTNKQKLVSTFPTIIETPYIIVSNITNEYIISNAYKEAKLDLKQYNIQIMSPISLQKHIEGLAD